MNKLCCFIILFFTCRACDAQIDLQCNGRDMHSIYLIDFNSVIYRIDSVDTSPTNPILLISNLPSYEGGISINANLDSIAGPETMYYVDEITSNYSWWNGTNWTNTNHYCGSNSAVNPGGNSNYIFNLDGNGNSLYRYDGTGNGTLLLSNLNTLGSSLYDVATDNQGNFYLFYSNLQKIIAYNPTGIPIDSFTVTGFPGAGGGFAILGNKMYAFTTYDLFEGIKTGSNINFTLIASVPFFVDDIAACPEAGNPLFVANNVAFPGIIIYPNPVRDLLHITTNNNEPLEIILYDITSRKLLQEKFTNAISINTGQFAKGIYIYEAKNKNGLIKQGKIVKD